MTNKTKKLFSRNKLKSARLIIERNLDVTIYPCSLLYKHHFYEKEKSLEEKVIKDIG
jgi:hypothetical protein